MRVTIDIRDEWLSDVTTTSDNDHPQRLYLLLMEIADQVAIRSPILRDDESTCLGAGCGECPDCLADEDENYHLRKED